MKRKPKLMKPVRAWALVSDDRVVTAMGSPLVYGRKRDAWLDRDDSWRIARVEIREVGRKK